MRGHRKRGQFAFTLWYPDGSRFEVKSTKDLDLKQWAKDATGYLLMLQRSVQSTVQREKDKA